MRLDPFYPIVDSAGWVARLVPLGVKLIQLRIKDADETALFFEIDRARRVCEGHGCTLVINDHWRLAIGAGCDFVHLGQEDLDEADLDLIRSSGTRIGISTHDEAELDRALALRPDYVALGPIRRTTLKPMRWEPQGVERIREWRRRIGDLPLVAIGGLKVDDASEVLTAGADSVAVVSDIISSDDPLARTRQWLTATQFRRLS